MEYDFSNLLLADTATAAIVGQKIYWGVAAQGDALPYMVLNLVSPGVEYTFEGPDDLTQARVQIDCYAKDHISCLGLANAVLAKVSGFKGVQGTTQFQGIFVDAVQDGFEFDPTPSDDFRRRIDVIISSRGV